MLAHLQYNRAIGTDVSDRFYSTRIATAVELLFAASAGTFCLKLAHVMLIVIQDEFRHRKRFTYLYLLGTGLTGPDDRRRVSSRQIWSPRFRDR